MQPPPLAGNLAKQSIKGFIMTIKKDNQTGLYTARHEERDGRVIECQAQTAASAMSKVYQAIIKGFL